LDKKNCPITSTLPKKLPKFNPRYRQAQDLLSLKQRSVPVRSGVGSVSRVLLGFVFWVMA